MRPALRFLCLSLPLAVCAAEPAAVDKRAYSLANPVPANLLRELSTDRPDATESPFTVDPGHAQLELDLVAVTRDRQGGVRRTGLSVAPFNLRLGLRHNFEVGIFYDPYLRETEQARGAAKTKVRGSGDTTLRFKLNLRGNDGGGVGFGVMADLKLPTATAGLGNDKVEGACTFPVSVELGGGWDLGGMTTLATIHDGTRYRPIWGNTITVGHDLVENVGAFAEIASEAGDGPHVATFDLGLTWRLDRDVQFDAGAYLGITRHAPDVTWFVGLTRRF